MPQCINKDYINVKMKLRELKYAFKPWPWHILSRSWSWTTYSRGFQKIVVY